MLELGVLLTNSMPTSRSSVKRASLSSISLHSTELGKPLTSLRTPKLEVFWVYLWEFTRLMLKMECSLRVDHGGQVYSIKYWQLNYLHTNIEETTKLLLAWVESFWNQALDIFWHTEPEQKTTNTWNHNYHTTYLLCKMTLTSLLAMSNPRLLNCFHCCTQLWRCTQHSFTLWQVSWSAIADGHPEVVSLIACGGTSR